MLQTLQFIPHEIAGLPVFGAGWALMAWAIFGVLLMLWLVSRQGWNRETTGYLPFLMLVAAAIYFLLPLLEVKLPAAEQPIGLPIRGYGVMLLLGVVSGVGVAVYRARQVGLQPDHIYGLAFWMFLAGIAGARLFYIIEYWEYLQQDSWRLTLWEILKFTKGGLVVYGSLIGGVIAFALFAAVHRLPLLRLGDVIAPGMVIGLAIGRVGCLLNGCCYGGICEDGPRAIRFPMYSSTKEQTFSPAYARQLSFGQLHGIEIGAADRLARPIVRRVQPQSNAAASGITTGAEIKSINGSAVNTLDEALRVMVASSPHISIETADDRIYQWSIGVLPDHSLPVHPTQLYSSINALLLFAVLWFLFPLRLWDGVVIGVLLTIYPVTRFLLEMIRTDEPGQFGTALSISQIISLLALVLMFVYWPCVMRQPRLAGHK